MFSLLIAAVATVVPATLNEIASMPAWQGTVEMSVESPALETDRTVSYSVKSLAAQADSLVGAEYVVTWPDDHIEAYAQGSLYARAGSGLMTELHPDSATMANRHERPIAADLICKEIVPQALAHTLIEALRGGEYTLDESADGKLTLTSISTSRKVSVEPSDDKKGATTVTVSTGGSYPTTATYVWQPDSAFSTEPLTFENILEANHKLFNRYNARFITPESLIGTPMPGFRLRTLDGDRYEWRPDALHRVTTLIAILDDAGGITRVREAAGKTDGGNCDILFIFTANNPEEVSEWGISTRANERILLRGNDLLRATGHPSLPAIFIVDTDGIISRIML